MQALGSYEGGKMLFLGLGTGLGSALVVDGIVEPMELGHLPFRKATFEDYVGDAGPRAPRQEELAARPSSDVVERLAPRSSPTTSCSAAGTPRSSTSCRRTCARGERQAFVGGFRLWGRELSASPP